MFFALAACLAPAQRAVQQFLLAFSVEFEHKMVTDGSTENPGALSLSGQAMDRLPPAAPQAGHEGSTDSFEEPREGGTMLKLSSDQDVRIIVADDHPIISLALADSLNEVPGFTVVATARSGLELITAVQDHPCHLIVTDFSMAARSGDEDGLRLIERLQRLFPEIPIVVFTMLSNSGILNQLRQVGVNGIVSKEEPIDELVSICIRALSESGPILSNIIGQRLSQNDVTMGRAGKAKGLSPKELEVVRLFSQGLSVTEIARRLHRSVATIGTQKQSAMRKLNIESNAELLRYADEQGFS
ncbi:response regulator transcription factor [Achromobacter spanius]|uniref:response regulator transcription factor n=1 Tax=Achromobacter spanius TaxID=217203 RepID=UPI00320A75DF